MEGTSGFNLKETIFFVRWQQHPKNSWNNFQIYITPPLWHPQDPSGCLEKQNHQLSLNLVIARNSTTCTFIWACTSFWFTKVTYYYLCKCLLNGNISSNSCFCQNDYYFRVSNKWLSLLSVQQGINKHTSVSAFYGWYRHISSDSCFRRHDYYFRVPNKQLSLTSVLTEEAYSHGGLRTREFGQTLISEQQGINKRTSVSAFYGWYGHISTNSCCRRHDY